jgi:hypothetical protein
MASNDSQDWTPVVLRRNKTHAEKIKAGQFVVEKRAVPTNKPKQEIINKGDANDYEAVGSVAKPDMTLRSAIMKCRVELQMTQSDLDKKCNFPQNTTRDYENGTAAILLQQLNIYDKILKTHLPRPRKKKKVVE